jgi:hypothetical protein
VDRAVSTGERAQARDELVDVVIAAGQCAFQRVHRTATVAERPISEGQLRDSDQLTTGRTVRP